MNLKTFQRKWRIEPATVQSYLRRVWRHILDRGAFPAPVARHASPAIPRRSMKGGGRKYSSPCEVTVVLLNDAQIQRYNKDYRNRDYPTDVLSFPVNELQDQSFYLGDILISTNRTAQQALEKRHTMRKELKILLLHGFLHLLGYDHEVDSGQMERLEKRIRTAVL